MIVRCCDLCGDSYRQSEGAGAAVYLRARLVPASGAVAGEADKVGLRFWVWRHRWFSFGGGGDNNFRSFRGSVSYLWVF